METHQHQPTAVFLQTVIRAVGQLKQQLQSDYERTYPELAEIIHLVLDEEETKAWELSFFPHLFLPDLVEEHIASLNLRPVETKHDDVFAPRHFNENQFEQPAFALCA